MILFYGSGYDRAPPTSGRVILTALKFTRSALLISSEPKRRQRKNVADFLYLENSGQAAQLA
jgi:hypothetical protein